MSNDAGSGCLLLFWPILAIPWTFWTIRTMDWLGPRAFGGEWEAGFGISYLLTLFVGGATVIVEVIRWGM